MRIYGLNPDECRAFAQYIGCDFQYTGSKQTCNGWRTWGRPVPGRGERTPSGRIKAGTFIRYQRYSNPERAARWGTKPRGLNALCFHGLRDYIRTCFEFGATRVQSVAGDWHSIEEFEDDLPRLAHNSLSGPGGYNTDDEWIQRCRCDGEPYWSES